MYLEIGTEVTEFVILHEKRYCPNTAKLGDETHSGVEFHSVNDCADYIINFGRLYRGCDGVWFSYKSSTKECFCTIFNDCHFDFTTEDDSYDTYVYTKSNIINSSFLNNIGADQK